MVCVSKLRLYLQLFCIYTFAKFTQHQNSQHNKKVVKNMEGWNFSQWLQRQTFNPRIMRMGTRLSSKQESGEICCY